MGKDQIDFPAYCRTMEVLKDITGVCDFLDDGREFYVVDVMNRGSAGDGIVSVPEYRLERGQSKVVGLRLLTEEGKIILKSDKGESVITSLNPEAAKVFIAGAFGRGELKGGNAPDQAIIEGLGKLYPLCARDWQTCLDSPEAKAVAAAWDKIKAEQAAREDEKKRLAERRQAVAKLKSEYEGLAAAIEKKSDLNYKVVPFVSALPADPATETELAAAERNLGMMIEVARSVAGEEKARKDQEQKRVELASYRSAMPGMREKVRKAEGIWYSRFTDAYDAAMVCMPIASTPEEEYCVARNAYTMGNGLAWKADLFPARAVCDRREEYEHCSGGRDPTCNTRTECTSSHTKGVDYTSDELRSFATGYCTTQCR